MKESRPDRQPHEDEALSSLYRRAPRPTSPAALDRRILAAAADRVGPRPHLRQLRWFPAVSFGAMAVLMLLIVLPVRPPLLPIGEPEPHPVTIRPAGEDLAEKNRAQATADRLMEEFADYQRPTLAVPPRAEKPQQQHPVLSRDAGETARLFLDKPPRPSAAATAPASAPLITGKSVNPQAPNLDETPLIAAEPPPQLASPFASQPLRETRLNTAAVREPEPWLRDIATLLDQGHNQAALREYQQFLLAHPSYTVDADLGHRLDKLRAPPPR